MTAFAQSSVLTGHTRAVVACRINPNGNLIASASADGTAKIWDMDSGECRSTLNGHAQGICDVTWSASGDYLCTASDDHTLKLWVGSRRELGSWPA